MSFQGVLKQIYIAAKSGGQMTQLDAVQAIAGQGLDSDRYAKGEGTFGKDDVPDYEVTFIESEAIAAAAREYDFELTAAETRRNLITEGVPLNHLVDREFEVGGVRFRGIRLCEPCRYLTELLNKPVLQALRHRGGLRAQIIEGGEIKVGDGVTPR